MKFETIHGFDLRCIPWDGVIQLSFLTALEDFDLHEAYTDDYFLRWRLDNLPCYGYKLESVRKWMKIESEKSGISLQCLELFLNACGTALKSPEVQNILHDFNLSDHFQITVFNHNADRPWRNYYNANVETQLLS